MNPEDFVKEEALNLKAFVQNPRYNPTGKDPTRVEKLRMVAEIKRASALMEVLEAEVRIAVAEGMQKLSVRGEYIDYAAGEKFHSQPGVVTAAEQLEGGGTRLFYFQQEDFPDLYAKKKERRDAPERAVRRVLALLQPPSTQDPTAGQQPPAKK